MTKLILAISPDQTLLDQISAHLQEGGRFQVFASTSGKYALSLAAGRNFNLAILDAETTDIPVIPLTRELTALLPNVRLLVYPPQNNPQHSSLSGLHTNGYLNKPFFGPEVNEMISRALQSTDSPGGSSSTEMNITRLWVEHPESGQNQIEQLLASTSAVAGMLLVHGQVIAGSGILKEEAYQNVIHFLMRYWMNIQAGELFRYLKMESESQTYLVYATPLLKNVAFALVYHTNISLMEIRKEVSEIRSAFLARYMNTADLRADFPSTPFHSITSASEFNGEDDIYLQTSLLSAGQIPEQAIFAEEPIEGMIPVPEEAEQASEIQQPQTETHPLKQTQPLEEEELQEEISQPGEFSLPDSQGEEEVPAASGVEDGAANNIPEEKTVFENSGDTMAASEENAEPPVEFEPVKGDTKPLPVSKPPTEIPPLENRMKEETSEETSSRENAGSKFIPSAEENIEPSSEVEITANESKPPQEITPFPLEHLVEDQNETAEGMVVEPVDEEGVVLTAAELKNLDALLAEMPVPDPDADLSEQSETAAQPEPPAEWIPTPAQTPPPLPVQPPEEIPPAMNENAAAETFSQFEQAASHEVEPAPVPESTPPSLNEREEFPDFNFKLPWEEEMLGTQLVVEPPQIVPQPLSIDSDEDIQPGNEEETLPMQDISSIRFDYQFLLLPRNQKQFITQDLSGVLNRQLPRLLESYGWQCKSISARPLYLLWSALGPADSNIHDLIAEIKDRLDIQIFDAAPALLQNHPSGQFWADGYFALSGSTSISKRLINDYISNFKQAAPSADQA